MRHAVDMPPESLSLFVSLSLSSTVCCDESRLLKATHRDWRARPSSCHRQGGLANGMAHDLVQRVLALRAGGWPTAPRPSSKRATTAGRRNSSAPSPKGKQRASRNGAAVRVSGSRVRESEGSRECNGRGTCAQRRQEANYLVCAARCCTADRAPPSSSTRSVSLSIIMRCHIHTARNRRLYAHSPAPPKALNGMRNLYCFSETLGKA